MAKNSAKSTARKMFLDNPLIKEDEIYKEINGAIELETIKKYLIEFRKIHKTEIAGDVEQISMAKLEKELAIQLEVNPNSTVIKSCIDFLKLKQQASDSSEEINMEEFLKIGKKLIN